MGPSVKFVLTIIDSISKKKMGVNFFSAKLDTKGGGSEGFVSDATKITCLIFQYFPYLINKHHDAHLLPHIDVLFLDQNNPWHLWHH